MPEIAARELEDLLAELGRRWAMSPRRLHPAAESLNAWDNFIQEWKASKIPLILRRGTLRKSRLTHKTGREIIFADNGPAHWAFNLAVKNHVPVLNPDIIDSIPRTFIGKYSTDPRSINKTGWKLCHIAPVSDRKRYKIETAPITWVEDHFVRFLSPRNMFVVPKKISGAGELGAVIDAIREFERHRQ